MVIALLGRARVAGPARRPLRRPDAWGDRREDRVEPLHRLVLAADHQAVTRARTPTRRRSCRRRRDGCLWLTQRGRVTHVVAVVGVAAVDDRCRRARALRRAGDRLVGDLASRDHHPGRAGLLELGDEVLRVTRRRPPRRPQSPSPLRPTRRSRRNGARRPSNAGPCPAPIRPSPTIPNCIGLSVAKVSSLSVWRRRASVRRLLVVAGNGAWKRWVCGRCQYLTTVAPGLRSEPGRAGTAMRAQIARERLGCRQGETFAPRVSFRRPRSAETSNEDHQVVTTRRNRSLRRLLGCCL